MLFRSIVGLAVYYSVKNSKDEIIEETISAANSHIEEILKYNFYEVTEETEFLSIERSVNTYFRECYRNDIENIVKLLDENYISENNITADNIMGKLKYYRDFNCFFVEKIYYQNNEENERDIKGIYYIKGTLWRNSYKNKEEIFMILNINLEDYTFKIVPQDNLDLSDTSFDAIISEKQKDFIRNYSYDEIIDEVNYDNDFDEEGNYGDELRSKEEQENKEINYLYFELEDTQRARRYLNELVIDCLYNNKVQNMYNLLKEECKNSKFQTIDKFNKYINENAMRLVNMQIADIIVTYESGTYFKIYNLKSNEGIVVEIDVNNAEDYLISFE